MLLTMLALWIVLMALTLPQIGQALLAQLKRMVYTFIQQPQAVEPIGVITRKKGKFWAISTGCILILDEQWDAFEKQIGHNGFTLILNRQ